VSDYTTAENCIAEVTSHGIDVDALGESLQRQRARAFEADWATLLEAISTKATQLLGTGHASGSPSTAKE
jgi:hypothetical protein